MLFKFLSCVWFQYMPYEEAGEGISSSTGGEMDIKASFCLFRYRHLVAKFEPFFSGVT